MRNNVRGEITWVREDPWTFQLGWRFEWHELEAQVGIHFGPWTLIVMWHR